MPRTVSVVRTDLGAPVVAVRVYGASVVVLVDHEAPHSLIMDAANVAALYLGQRSQRPRAPCP
jgi:hypothetical protein